MQTPLRKGPYGSTIAILATGIAISFTSLACNPFDQGENCSPACESTFTCDTSAGVCRPSSLASFDAPPPGRHLATTVVDGEPFLAAIAPEKGLVVAGVADSSNDYLVLDQLQNADRASVAVAAGADGPAVAWLAAGDTYRIATRREGRWRVEDVSSESDYRGSRHLDLAATGGGLRLAFRDRRENGLRALVARPDGPWQLQSIDDGTAVEGRSQCAADVGDPSRAGVGFEPDAEWFDGTLVVSYYDADCGDLRLARRNDDAWSVNVIDTGNFIIGGANGLRQSGDVGRHSSLAADTNSDLAIAYQDVGRGRLKFARQTSSGFDVQLVDPGIHIDEFSQKRKQLVGAFADVVFQRIDNTDVPYIAYMNASETQIRLAYRLRRNNSPQWVHRKLAPDPPTGFYAAIEAPTSTDFVVFAERLAPADDGVSSELIRLEQEVP